jgi:T3SS (YopN, CesT) and YbjN peptide-binding chaperone 1
MADRHIEVNAMAVRHALARTFTGVDPGGHSWRGTTATGDAVVTVDVEPAQSGAVHVRAWAPALETGPLDARIARVLAGENAELVLGRFRHCGGEIVVEHTILAGTTMDPVEVQSSVWTVGWAAASYAPRLRALLTDAVPVPHTPQTPAARLRDAADHVEMTTRRVRRYLDERYGGFEHHPDWGFHGAFGSARVFVDVLPVLDDSTAVRASAPVLSDVDLSDGLALRVAELTGDTPFGAFAHLIGRRELWFQHSILGDDLDGEELEAAIDAVAAVADGWDDRLAEEFGGLRYADLG